MKARGSLRTPALAGLLLGLGTTLPTLALLGCPGPEPHARGSGEGGAGGAGGAGAGGRAAGGSAAGGSAAGGEASDGAAAGGTQSGGGSSGGAGLDGSTGSGGVRGCELGAKRCEDAVPQTCDANGEWQSESPCPVSAPVCNSGTCGTYRLIGGVDALGKRPAPIGIRLKNEALSNEPRLCKDTLCITGGITP